MPNVNDLGESKYLKQHDVDPDVLVTVKGYDKVNVAMESQQPEMKWSISFEELDKPLILNKTNGTMLQLITGSGDFDDWIGKKVVLFNDPTVSYAGKITGGIRIRKPKGTPTTAEVLATPAEKDDIPF